MGVCVDVDVGVVVAANFHYSFKMQSRNVAAAVAVVAGTGLGAGHVSGCSNCSKCGLWPTAQVLELQPRQLGTERRCVAFATELDSVLKGK